MKKKINFEWDEGKNGQNIEKHGVTFYEAQYAFADENRVILEDLSHSKYEKRYYCIGKLTDGIITVRYTHRRDIIR